MDATQMISDSFLESDEEESEEEIETNRGKPLAELRVLKNPHIPETELPLYLGENVLGRDTNCSLSMPSPSVSKQHATIAIVTHNRRGCHNTVDVEALVWDLGSMNGTRKGRLKLTPHVRYALSERDSLVVADIPCQYVSCAADSVNAQGDFKKPLSRNSGVKAGLSNASGEREGDTSTGSTTCVNGDTEAAALLPGQGDTGETLVRASCLSFEPTPTKPQGNLVPESDSDSDGENCGIMDRRRKALASDSDFYKSSPSSSTFLSPANNIVPESEDESPITPSVSKNRPPRHVSISEGEAEVDLGRQQLKEKKATVDDSEEEEGLEQERAALGGGKAEENGQHVPEKQESNVSLSEEDELPVSRSAVRTDAIPGFHMDSDTDVEGEEEEVAPAAPPEVLETDQPPNSAQLHMDSDTDVEGEEEEVAPAAPPESLQTDQPPNSGQLHMDSDTDVDDDDDAIDSAPRSVPSSADSTKPPHVIQPQATAADSGTDVDDDDGVDAAASVAASKAKPGSSQSAATADSLPKDFHLDSDTDVDEENESGKMNASSEIDETPSRVDTRPVRPESTPVAPPILRSDSDTDDEAVPVPAAASEASVVSAVTESRTAANTVAHLDILSDSDTDAEDNSPLVEPLVAPGAASEAVKAASDADTNVDESSLPPAGDETNISDNVDFGRAPERQIPNLCREITPCFLEPTAQNCSTPIESSGAVEEMETQAFHSPSSAPFIRFGAPALGPKELSYCSDSQEDEDFTVAETQSFVLQTRGNPAENGSMDSEDFVPESSGDEKGEQSTRGGSFQLGLSDSSFLQDQVHALAMENTQAFPSVVANLETQAYAVADSTTLEATQAYLKEEEPAEKGEVDLDLIATQAYVSEPCSDSGDETDKDEREDIDTAETQLLAFPTTSTLAMAETQPASAFEEEECVDEQGPGLAAQPQERLLSEAVSAAATQPMCASDGEESDQEDSISRPRKRKARPLQLEEEQTQPLTSPGSTLIETQPMSFCDTLATSENDESDEEDSFPGPRKRKPKPLQIEDEQTQPLTSSDVLPVETQPMDASVATDSDEEDLIPRPRKRKAKTLHIEDEQSQVITSSEVSALETQPMKPPEAVESDEEDSVPSLRKRKAKPLQIQDEESQLLNLRGKRRVGLRKEEEQEECSDPPKRQTRGKNKALPATRGRRGKPRPDEDESEDEETGGQAGGARKKRSTRQQKNKDEEEEMERNSNSPREEQDERAFRQDIGEQEKLVKGQRRGGRKKTAQCSREEQEKMERIEKEEQERLQAEEAERLRLEQEKAEKEMMERERMEHERAEREERERDERIENERKEQEEKEKLERAKREQEEQLERERKEKERLEKEKREQEEQLERERKEKERLEKEKREQEEQLERERKEKERLEKEKREQEEQLERERKEQEHQERLEREAKEKERLEKEKLEKEAQEETMEDLQNKEEGEEKSKTPARGRRAARRTIAELPTLSASDDCPARRTRSRSNSSNSISSERSASSVDPQESRGRGRGRGVKRASEPPQPAASRRSTRMRIAAAEPSNQDSSITPQGVHSRSNSTSSEISTCSLNSQSRGRGGRQQGRGRKTEVNPVPPIDGQSDQNPALKPTPRGRKSTRVEEPSNVEHHEVKVDSQQPSTTRGRRRTNAKSLEATAANEEDPSEQVEEQASEESLQPKRSIRGKGQRVVKGEPVEAAADPAVGHGEEAEEERKGREQEPETNTEEESASAYKMSKEEEKTQTVQAKRRGRASTAQAKKNSQDSSSSSSSEVKESEESVKMEEGVERKVRGRSTVTQRQKRAEQEDLSPNDAHMEASEPQTPTASASRKRQAPPDASPAAKTPRSSSASPAASLRARAAGQAYKVLFTGVTDEAGEKLLPRLGGTMAKDVADMNFLVTDKVRRTVKFLCAVAKGIPIITTLWLEKSGKAGSFLPPNMFLVKDREQEKKFNFSLQESLRIASSQPLLQGYEIHVTKSVKPEPVHMKDIIACSGASFLPKMPTSPKARTVVISCEEDWALCRPALAASLPVVSAEFILTGILQQRIDLETHSLSAPASNPPAAGGRGRGRKKS